MFLLSAAELSVALIVGARFALVSNCVCELRLLFALLLPLSPFVVHVEDAMTLLLRILWVLLARLAAGEVDDRKALGCIAGWWFRGSSFAPPMPLLVMPFLPPRALLDTRSRLRSLSWKKMHFVRQCQHQHQHRYLGEREYCSLKLILHIELEKLRN